MWTCAPPKGRVLGKKGWATLLLWELQVALPGLRAVRLFPARDTVESLLGIMATHTVGKPKAGLCAIYHTNGLVHFPMRMDMIAINNYFVPVSRRLNILTFLFNGRECGPSGGTIWASCPATRPCPLSTTSPISLCPLSIG